jgi:ABC-2 type transport system permease protein
MKALTIALKDMWRAFRSMFALAFMFGVPILMTLIFSFLFGGMFGSNDSEFSLPKTEVVIVNLDEGSPYVEAFETESGSVDNLGEMLVEILKGETFQDLMSVNTAGESAARQAVDSQEAGLAVILPPDLTNALIGTASDPASIEFYKDPELNLGPQITKSIVMSLVDSFASSSLSMDAVLATLENEGVTLSQQEQMALIATLTENAEETGENQSEGLTIIPPADSPNQQDSLLQNVLRGVMGGMMIFYAFFTGTSSAQSILQEEENGTLARLFTTPTKARTVLNGKIMAGFFMIIVQVFVLIGFSRLVFKIQWGSILPLMIASIGLVAAAASFGIFVMSLAKSTKQAGVLYGGLLTFTGMLGISGVFTGGTPIEEAFRFLPLLVPQGWAMRAYEAVWQGNVQQVLLFTAGMFAWAVILFLIGNSRFNKRFA